MQRLKIHGAMSTPIRQMVLVSVRTAWRTGRRTSNSLFAAIRTTMATSRSIIGDLPARAAKLQPYRHPADRASADRRRSRSAGLNSLANAPGLKVAGGYLNASLIMQLNYKTPPFDNVKLRQALAYAIPYADIAKTSYFGSARQWNGLIPSTYPGYIKPDHTYSYDPEKAKALLAEAGFPGGKGLEAYPGIIQARLRG